MLRNLFLTAIVGLFSFSTQAQDMNAVLKKTFIAFDTTRDADKMIAGSNKIELITKKWSDEWVTHYYNAYCKAQLSHIEKDPVKRDAYVDEAEAELEEAISLLGKEDDEIYVMKAMLAQARLSVDGRSRWKKYGKIFEDNLQKAKEVNEENPRIYYLKGTSVFFTPKMFGGGAKNAQEYFERADKLFEQEDDSDMKEPFWGKHANKYFIAQCEEALSKEKKEEKAETEEG